MNIFEVRELLLRGWKYCEWGHTTNANTSVSPNGRKVSHRRKDGQCRHLVSPKQMVRMGRPICPAHEPHYIATLQRTSDRIVALRKKLDPGPVDI